MSESYKIFPFFISFTLQLIPTSIKEFEQHEIEVKFIVENLLSKIFGFTL